MRVIPPLLVLLVVTAGGHAQESAGREFFEKRVRPLLAQHCFECHSAKTKKQRGGLYLDSKVSLLRGGDNGPAVVPGKPEASLLLKAVRHESKELHMPPKKKLAGRDVAVLEEWIRRGAEYPDVKAPATVVSVAEGKKYWAFQPLTVSPAPTGTRPAASRLDQFLFAAMRGRKLSPSREADRRTLIRRLSFDLIGLPPSPEEVEAFVRDPAPDAYERLVERLLASPRHGERWARFWLDMARYCDVAEDWVSKKNQPYRYRDWVVRAINEDMPYDRFALLQLAADQVTDARPDDRAALGFLGLSPVYWKELKLAPDVVKVVVAEEWEERIHTVTGTFLALTVACARCHDHKFDPITTKDYYALAGVFASTREADLKLGEQAMVPGVVDAGLFVVPDGPDRTKLDWKPGKPRDLAVQVRGNPASLGPVIPRQFLSVLSSKPTPFRHGSGRLDLANAILSDATPLAARVIVNRVWGIHFGTGLVDTPSDFGIQGSRPTHPELLDDLARRFIASGWSLRWLHREIVLSAAYRQSSKQDPLKQAIDPDNRYLWRMNRRKLEVEAWRDAMLAVTGTLDGRLGGPPQDLGDLNNRRRTLYGVIKRQDLNDLLRLHDFPDPTVHSATRIPTTTPLQQLYVLNSPFIRQQSALLTQRLKRDAGDDPTARVKRAYALLFGREPRESERKLAEEFLADPAAWASYCQVLLGTNEFLFID